VKYFTISRIVQRVKTRFIVFISNWSLLNLVDKYFFGKLKLKKKDYVAKYISKFDQPYKKLLTYIFYS